MPPSNSWNPPRAKVQLKLAIQRIRLLATKKSQLAKVTRREIGGLLEQNRIETAKIKVEGVMGDDQTVELLEVLELYCELLLARFGILETIREVDPGVAEAVVGVIHAAPRTELKELYTLREMLMSKYGRDFSIACMDNTDDIVSKRITSKLAITQPDPALVDLYLHEIAKAYGVNWEPEGYSDSTLSDHPIPTTLDSSSVLSTSTNNSAHPAAKISPFPEIPSIAPSDLPHTVIIHSNLPPNSPGLKSPSATMVIPSAPLLPPSVVAAAASSTSNIGLTTDGKKSENDAFDALTRRFAELKKR